MLIVEILDVRLVIADSELGNPVVDILHNDGLYRLLEGAELRSIGVDLLILIIRDLVDQFGSSGDIEPFPEMRQPVRREDKASRTGRWIESPSYEKYEDQGYDEKHRKNRFLADIHLLP